MKSRFYLLYFGVLIGGFFGWIGNVFAERAAQIISELFINLLKLVSLPIIFLSIVSTATGMGNLETVKNLGGRVMKYTLLTTATAAAIALALFLFIDPVDSLQSTDVVAATVVTPDQGGYLSYLVRTIPSNFLQPFVENHVIGVLFLGLLLSAAVLSLPDEKRLPLHFFFSSLYSAVMVITGWVVSLMPLAVAAFVFLFVKELQAGALHFEGVALYLLCVVLANVLQACIVLPLLLKAKGVPVWKLAKGVSPALSLAFFSKSSSAALPMAMRCMRSCGVSSIVADFALPLCTTINMNACAAFILTTVLYVSMSCGVHFTTAELISWVFIATIAAIGNAGVPMGCFFLASALLAAMNVPLAILGLILPFYAMIDMLESAINVWSDACVTAVVDREVSVIDHPTLAVNV